MKRIFYEWNDSFKEFLINSVIVGSLVFVAGIVVTIVGV